MEIGSKGLQEVNLTIPQGTSLTFNITHKDEEEHVVDHSQSTARMAFVGKAQVSKAYRKVSGSWQEVALDQAFQSGVNYRME